MTGAPRLKNRSQKISSHAEKQEERTFWLKSHHGGNGMLCQSSNGPFFVFSTIKASNRRLESFIFPPCFMTPYFGFCYLICCLVHSVSSHVCQRILEFSEIWTIERQRSTLWIWETFVCVSCLERNRIESINFNYSNIYRNILVLRSLSNKCRIK